MNNMSDLEIGYLVGIIAGEGTIRLERNKRNNYLSPNIKVSNTEPALLYNLRNMTGLGYVSLDAKPKKANHRRTLQWEVINYDVLPLLDVIIPGLELFGSAKAEQGKLLRAYIIMYQRDYRFSKKGITKKLHPCELAVRQSYFQRITDLKFTKYLSSID